MKRYIAFPLHTGERKYCTNCRRLVEAEWMYVVVDEEGNVEEVICEKCRERH
jgi:RNase P subunit RPR2